MAKDDVQLKRMWYMRLSAWHNNTGRWFGKKLSQGCRSKNKPPWRRKKKKTLKNPVINFSLAAVFCEVVSATPPPHKHTPYFHGFDWDWRCWRRSLQKKNQHWLPFSQLNTKRLALLKFSTSASGLGYRKRRGEKKKQEKGTLLHFLKFWL